MHRWIVLLALLAAWPASAQSLRVEREAGATDIARETLQSMAGGATTLEVLEPHEGVRRSYVGVPVVAVLDGLYGEAWRDAGRIAFDCADGYRALVEPAALLGHRALLAWARADGAPFALVNRLQNDEAVSLAPFYLVWDNLGTPALQAEGASGWPYQVVGIALVDPAVALSRTLPPPTDRDDPAVQRGLVAFRTHCLACHSINGQGGGKAPELNHPASVTEYLAPGWLQRWMLDPRSVRYDTTMPGLPQTLPDRDAVAADIERYLQAMARRPWDGRE